MTAGAVAFCIGNPVPGILQKENGNDVHPIIEIPGNYLVSERSHPGLEYIAAHAGCLPDLARHGYKLGKRRNENPDVSFSLITFHRTFNTSTMAVI